MKLKKKKLKVGFVYVVDFYYKGVRHVFSTGTDNRVLAMRVLKSIEEKIVLGTFNIEGIKSKTITLNEFFDQYFPYACSIKSPMSIVRERQHAKGFVQVVGNCDIRSIDARRLDEWKVELLKRVSPATFNSTKGTLQAMFSIALKWGYVDTNVFRSISKLKLEERRLYLTPPELKKVVGLIVDDVARAEGEQKAYNEKFLLLILLLVNTGLRRGEALGLKTENIDLDSGLIVLDKTKSKRIRVVPMNKVVRNILERLGDTLFSGMESSAVSHKFKRYLRDAGLDGFRLHSLRHSFATSLVASNTDLYKVSTLLGHASVQTSAIYAKPNMKLLEEAVKSIEVGDDLVTRMPSKPTEHDV